MWKNNWPLCCASAFTLLLCVTHAAQYPHAKSQHSDYSITPSNQLAYYHYPTPNRPLITPHQQRSYAQPQQQQHRYQQQQQQYHQQQQQQPYYRQQQRQQLAFITSNARPQSTFYQQPQQQQQQQQYQQPQRRPAASAPVQQQFSSPALENAAFTQALTSQGYAVGGGGSSGRALQSSAASSNNVVDTPDASVNVKLPLPINVAPIKTPPLPLQAGAPFDSIVRGVTSYGTVYPQRKR